MVGRRPRAVNWAQGHYKSLPILPLSKKRQQVDEEAALLSQNGQQEHQRDDRAKITRHTGFKDHSALLKAEQRRNDLKRRVLQGMRGFNVIELDRKFRKSPCELKKIKSKPVRQFYESQNNALDDWLEVDALVYAVADDVIDSMNPDADNDGIPERQIPLRTSQGQIDCFLPPEHRAARAKADKQA